ncbi:SMC domain protein [Thalassoporum mexicanum PCC 7367]|uniref:AAA family ATPase n=1 Tax=Thalassoporum mexicanum TaxID=3457544 RepID=UPI00029F830A|nr:SMC family ATPase [Pseudanabaena sp. PCC 7367]AFY70200.1 SMC domain protein [Pseudanabaena sp. PCC 7367]
MIPRKLSLRNFLSYQELVLDFAGLHTACICGANGAGKSSLLEAITWAIWGQSRVATEDDVVYVGATEAQVDFSFTAHDRTYRIMRTRPRGSATVLEFQMLGDGGYKSLTERGLRATQQAILTHLKMDYNTFVNSAYLRQGRADEFMLRRPGDRKQILVDMLNLAQYEHLGESAKDVVRDCKAEANAIAAALASLQETLAQEQIIQPQLAQLNQDLAALKLVNATTKQQLQTKGSEQQQRQNQQQQLNWQQRRYDRLQEDCQRLQTQVQQQHGQLRELEVIISHSDRIYQEHAHYQELCHREAEANRKSQRYQQLNQEKSQLQQAIAVKQSELKEQLKHARLELERLQQKQQELNLAIAKGTEIEAAVNKLHQARAQLRQFDRLQAQASPLIQRQHSLQRQLDQHVAKLTAQLDAQRKQLHQWRSQTQLNPDLLATKQQIDQAISHLQARQAYQNQVYEKGLERRSFLERLQERAQACQAQFSELSDRLAQLSQPHQADCPLCQQSLDHNHREQLKQKLEQEYQSLQAEIWVIKEQQAASECEIQVLRQEYRQLSQELAALPTYLQQKGHLEAQLQTSSNTHSQIQTLEQEIAQLETCLQQQDYLPEARAELDLVESGLAQLNYDERNHALVRGEAERWRWADLKLTELKKAMREHEQVLQQLPQQQAQVELRSQRLNQHAIDLELQQQLEQCDRQLAQIGYDPATHQQLRQAQTQAQPALLHYQELTIARQKHPEVLSQYQQTKQQYAQKQADLAVLSQEIDRLQQTLAVTPDLAEVIKQLEQELADQRSQIEQLIGAIARFQQTQQQLETQKSQASNLETRLTELRHRQQIHQELQYAFGKNGIQALMIETMLPQIEAETNILLAKLSNHQLHVRFITQKAGKRSDRLIDTLDIEIADSQGTRPYETYSGGESFRINFAIRLALSRVLAQRVGGKLQTLIIDEGFSTQDHEGCDRLVAAINAIAGDFACILVITHMPQLKEAFSHLIEVSKTNMGSKINLVA